MSRDRTTEVRINTDLLVAFLEHQAKQLEQDAVNKDDFDYDMAANLSNCYRAIQIFCQILGGNPLAAWVIEAHFATQLADAVRNGPLSRIVSIHPGFCRVYDLVREHLTGELFGDSRLADCLSDASSAWWDYLVSFNEILQDTLDGIDDETKQEEKLHEVASNSIFNRAMRIPILAYIKTDEEEEWIIADEEDEDDEEDEGWLQ